jgi:hypothetical protein
MRSEVLTAVKLSMLVFWVVMPCKLRPIDRYKHFGGTRRLYVRSEVLTAASMKMTVFWVVAPYSLSEVYNRPDDGGSKNL